MVGGGGIGEKDENRYSTFRVVRSHFHTASQPVRDGGTVGGIGRLGEETDKKRYSTFRALRSRLHTAPQPVRDGVGKSWGIHSE